MNRSIAIMVSAACAMLAAAAVNAQPDSAPSPASQTKGTPLNVRRVPGSYWSIVLPAGWEEGSPDELDAVNDAAKDLASQAGVSQTVSFKMLILPEDRDGRYLLVQEGSTLPAGLSFETISKNFAKGYEAGVKKANTSGTFSLGASKFEPDAVRRRILTRSDVGLGGPGTLGHFTLTSFAREGILSVHAYAPSDQYAQAEPSLLEVAKSIAIDPGHEYQFGTRSADGFDWSRVSSHATIGAAVGAILGVSAWLKRKVANN